MKKILIASIILWIFGCVIIFVIFKNNEAPAPDTVAINDAVMSNGNAAEALIEQLRQEYARMESELKNRDFKLQIFLCAYTGVLMIAAILFYFYCELRIFAPFRKMQGFARRIAAGNLEVPLEMDRNNLFGAFTESFDMMREELNKAKENELKADRSKKELVASLSHDIKTPVASIKAVSELMLVTAEDEKDKRRLETIGAKAEQINSLITNMFHATLEELQALSVSVKEFHSTEIPEFIKNADYAGRVKAYTVPSCIVLADPLRLQQIFDNIISNSYKYAGTDIEIRADFDGTEKFIVINIADSGPGVPQDELPFLANKFYRGKNAGNKSGYGLGLYISKYLLEQMSGELHILNCPDGFSVRLTLRLA